ncbi:MAG: hypothetical protein AAF639_27740 [Chloroflexota bacterium]
MSKSIQPILQEGKSYTFSDYFKMEYPTKDILAALDYQYRLQQLDLPHRDFEESLQPLKDKLYKRIPHVSLNSEAARREALIAPIIFEFIDYLEIDIAIEYPVYVSEWLKGNIDYFVRSKHHFLVAEAKKADMEKGFTQLAVELIAMDQRTDNADDYLYGAITVGDIWRFGMLDRKERTIYKDIDSFRVPSDIEGLFRVIMGILY